MEETPEEVGALTAEELFEYIVQNAEFSGDKAREIIESIITAFADTLRGEDWDTRVQHQYNFRPPK